jgi:hypothetical protein
MVVGSLLLALLSIVGYLTVEQRIFAFTGVSVLSLIVEGTKNSVLFIPCHPAG